MEYSINEIRIILKTSHNEIRNIIEKLYPDKFEKGRLFSEEEAEEIGNEFLRVNYPYLYGKFKWNEVFTSVRLYTTHEVSKMLGITPMKVKETSDRLFNKKIGKFKNTYYTKEEVELIKNNVKYRSGSIKVIDGQLKIFW